eukprot:g23623.t1
MGEMLFGLRSASKSQEGMDRHSGRPASRRKEWTCIQVGQQVAGRNGQAFRSASKPQEGMAFRSASKSKEGMDRHSGRPASRRKEWTGIQVGQQVAGRNGQAFRRQTADSAVTEDAKTKTVRRRSKTKEK